MRTTLHVTRLGDSLAIHIPEDVAQELGVREGSAVEIIADGDHLALKKKSYNLAQMVARITDSNLHAEQDFGPPLGKEVL